MCDFPLQARSWKVKGIYRLRCSLDVQERLLQLRVSPLLSRELASAATLFFFCAFPCFPARWTWVGISARSWGCVSCAGWPFLPVPTVSSDRVNAALGISPGISSLHAPFLLLRRDLSFGSCPRTRLVILDVDIPCSGQKVPSEELTDEDVVTETRADLGLDKLGR